MAFKVKPDVWAPRPPGGPSHNLRNRRHFGVGRTGPFGLPWAWRTPCNDAGSLTALVSSRWLTAPGGVRLPEVGSHESCLEDRGGERALVGGVGRACPRGGRLGAPARARLRVSGVQPEDRRL